jgi:hypothetical protein
VPCHELRSRDNGLDGFSGQLYRGDYFQTGTGPDICKRLVERADSDRGTEGVRVSGSAEFCGGLVTYHFADYIDSGFSIRHD